MNHDTNTADIAETAALVAEQRHRLATWPELVAALEGLRAVCPDTDETVMDRHFAELALARAKSPPAPEDRNQLYAPSIDRRGVEDLFE